MCAEYLDELRAIAETREREEDAFRRESEERLKTLAAARIAAYRRYHLLKGMAEAAQACATSEGVVPAELDFVLAETGWSEADAGYAEVRERLTEAASAVEAALKAQASAAASGEAGPRGAATPIDAFQRFEAWYRERFGSEFLDLLNRERAFLPVVDF